MSTHIFHRTAGMVGIAVAVPLIALATSALAAAGPDDIAGGQISYIGPGNGQSGTEFFAGYVTDLSTPTAGTNADGMIGIWTQTEQDIAGLNFNTNNSDYELYMNGTDSHDYMEMYSNWVVSNNSELWGSTFIEELNSSGTVIGMEDVVDFGGHDFTLFDTLTNGL